MMIIPHNIVLLKELYFVDTVVLYGRWTIKYIFCIRICPQVITVYTGCTVCIILCLCSFSEQNISMGKVKKRTSRSTSEKKTKREVAIDLCKSEKLFTCDSVIKINTSSLYSLII